MTLRSIDWVERRLYREVAAAGSQKAWAQQHRISISYVNDVLRGRRLPGRKFLHAMGLRGPVWRCVEPDVGKRKLEKRT